MRLVVVVHENSYRFDINLVESENKIRDDFYDGGSASFGGNLIS